MLAQWLVGTALLACSPKPATPEPAAASAPSETFGALDAHLAELAEVGRWQGSLVVTRAGEPVHTVAVGRIGLGDAPDVDAQTRFRVGSITKTLASVIVHQLVDEGTLALDAPLATWFPELPNATTVTVDHLLQHRSGLASFTDDPEYLTWNTTPASREFLVDKIARYPTVFEPDATSQYSNSNYVLLGFVIEDVEGRSFAESVQARIVEPLELSRTSVGDPVDPSNNEARSLEWTGDAWTLAPETHPSVPGAAGALVSTPTDLCTVAHALFSGELVSEASLANMRELADGYGRGLFPIPYRERTAFGHTGGIDGFSSMMGYFPDDGTCLAMTSHASTHSSNDLAIGALALHFGVPWTAPEVRARLALSAEQVEAYSGVYRSSTLPLVITLTRKDTVLWAQATGQPEFPLEPVGPTEFVFEDAGLRMVFDADEASSRFTLFQGGGEFLYVRDPS
ncbi:MAG: serine hydrolase domain-containing protein [Myxococcota bacterium]